MRVDRQAEQLRTAMGTMVFESYLPTVKAILERNDGHALLAVALKSFFEQIHIEKTADVNDDEARHDNTHGHRGGNRDHRGNKQRRDTRSGKPRSDKPRNSDRKGRKPRQTGDEKPRKENRTAEKPKSLPDDLNSLLSFD